LIRLRGCLLIASTLALLSCLHTEIEPDLTPVGAVPNAPLMQSATVGTAVPIPPSVKVINRAGQPLTGISVTFTVEFGGGSLTGAAQTSNAQGIATVGSWTLGPQPGQNTVAATVQGLEGHIPATFSATGTAP